MYENNSGNSIDEKAPVMLHSIISSIVPVPEFFDVMD